MAIVASNQISIVDVTDGAEGKGVSSVIPEYYLSTSKTTQTGGSWSTTPPTWSSGKYLWVRHIVIYTDSSLSRTQPYCDTSWEAVNEIEIGSRNLLLNTKSFTEASSTSLNGSLITGTPLLEDKYRDLAIRGCTLTEGETVVCLYNFTDFNLGDTFTFSFYAKGDVSELRAYFYGNPGYVQVAKCVNSLGETSTNADGWSSFYITSDWQRYWVTWTLKNTGDISVPKYVMLRTNDATSGQTVYVCGCKLETGNKATDWNPAPEDIDNNITDAVDAVEVGSRNIATGTANMVIGSGKWEKGHWRKSGTGTIETIDIVDSPVSGVNKGAKFTASTAGKQIGICQDLIPLNNSDIYTLSCWVRGSTSGLKCRLQPFYASSTDTGGIGTFTLTGKWQYISYTTVRSPLNTATYSGCYVYLIPSANVDTMEVCGLKLERGNKATDWSPAPEDVDAKTNEAAKTATNFMKFNNSVLVIGDMTADPLGNNVLIDSDSVDIRNGNTIRASYGNTTTIGGTTGKHILIDSDSVDIKNGGTILASYGKSTTIGNTTGNHVLIDSNSVDIKDGDTVLSQFTKNTIYLGKNGSGSTIDLCNGCATLSAETDNGYSVGIKLFSTGTLKLDSTSGMHLNSKIIGLTSQYSVDITAPSITLTTSSNYVYIQNPSESPANIIGITQEVTQGSLIPTIGDTVTKTIAYKSERTKVLIEMWTTGPSGYYNSDYKTISSPMTAVGIKTLTSIKGSVGRYSISDKGVITLYNVTSASATSAGEVYYRVTHFN